MQEWQVVLWWLAHVMFIGICLAIFEINLEKDKGWASGLDPRGWGRKLFVDGAFARFCEKPYLTVYHLVMFGVVVPAILITEYLTIRLLGIGHEVHGGGVGTSWAIQIGEARVVPILFLTAVWIALISVEDFLWFALNWYYPRSLKDLLSGKIWWHTHWVKIAGIDLPRFYFFSALMAPALLVASIRLAG
jgi:hypothetical protein